VVDNVDEQRVSFKVPSSMPNVDPSSLILMKRRA
jgi:hypothetical protein